MDTSRTNTPALHFFESLYNLVFSEKASQKIEKAIISLAIIGFLGHLFLILVLSSSYLNLSSQKEMLGSPLAAIYTPFSFILIYEVYLFIYFLPKSFSKSIGKQYEIVSLIIIRRIFKDISNLEIPQPWYQLNQSEASLLVDMGGIILIFLLIGLFHYFSERRIRLSTTPKIRKFIFLKKVLALFLVGFLIALSIYSFSQWAWNAYLFELGKMDTLKDVNYIFYNEFFTTLILADVLLLIVSLYYTHEYRIIIRNSGFVISTVLIRLSFGTDPVVNVVLSILAISFGLLVLLISNAYEKNLQLSKS